MIILKYMSDINDNIAIFTRSMNYRMYNSAMNCVKTLPYKHHRIMMTTSDSYLMAMLNSKYDWAINIDEDAFVFDIEALNELLFYCIDNGYVNCGMPDGGVLPIRTHNPLVTNPFFNILNLKELRKSYNPDVVRGYCIHRKEYEDKMPLTLIKGEYQYDYFEPYCGFFVWVSQNFPTLYLDAREHNDGISTVLLNHSADPFLVHTWYSRYYDKDQEHTNRINTIIKEYSSITPINYVKAQNDYLKNKAWEIICRLNRLRKV